MNSPTTLPTTLPTALLTKTPTGSPTKSPTGPPTKPPTGLADSGLSVVLLDRGPLTPGAVESDLPFEPRVSALSLASQRILQRLGAWDGILATQLDIRHRPCNFVELMPRLTER